jgi:hypothetical protein
MVKSYITILIILLASHYNVNAYNEVFNEDIKQYVE